MTPSVGLAEGMGSLLLNNFNSPRLLPVYPLPSLSLCLALDEGHPLLVLHPSLPSPTMTPPSSLTSSNSDDPFLIATQTFQLVQGPESVVWTTEERAVMQALFAHYKSKAGVDVVILEAGEGDWSPGGIGVLSESTGLREGGD